MGNIVGEKFDDFVVNQINARQNLYGKGFGSTQLSPSNLLLLNNRNAWLKLASSVNVVTQVRVEETDNLVGKGFIKVDSNLGTQRLKDIGIGAGEASSFLGSQLAQKAVLFNTLSTVTDNNKFAAPRSGVAKTNSLWNASNSYGLGGTDFGLNPAPGLISAKIDSLNRGSIRNATIEIKAFNKFQFEMLELVYLRLGFTMMLEWGFDKYIDNNGNLQNVGNTLIEEDFFTTKPTSQLNMLQSIQKNRQRYQGNCDGFFGKVVNFDWNFNKNGTYDIKLKLVTLGDVIESIKTKPNAKPLSVKKIGELILDLDGTQDFSEEEIERLEALEGSAIDNNAGSSPLGKSLFIDIINSKMWGNVNPNFFCWNNLDKVFEKGVDEASSSKWKALAGLANPLTIASSINILIQEEIKNPLQSLDQYSYYMTFEVLLNRISKYCVPSIGSEGNVEKQLRLSPIDDNYLCSAFPNQIAFDPKICLIKPIFTPNMVGEEGGEGDYIKVWDWINQLKPFGFLNDDNTVLYGNIMNIYLNYDFISKCLSKDMDENGNISIFAFLTRICEGVNSSLGNLQQLEVVVRDDIFVTIQDQNPIPGIERIEPNVAPSITPFEIFGFNTSGSVSSNFVTDFSFNTKITPQLASSISIGTTANNVNTKNYDGTAFSKWNSGLQDRYSSFYFDPSDVEKEKPTYKKDTSGALSDEQIAAEWKVWEVAAKKMAILRGTTLYKGNLKLEKFDYDGRETKNRKAFALKPKSATNGKVYTYKDSFPPSNSISWPEYIDAIIQDINAEKARKEVKDFTLKELNEEYKEDYNWYLIRAFSGKLSKKKATSTAGSIDIQKCEYFLMNGPFAEQGKSAFQSYINTNVINKQFNENDIPSNTIGFIPADLGLTFKGLSGIKIYQQLAVRQNFLPKQYSRALKFLIKGVNHSISNNDWSTNLTTLSIPNVEAKLNLDGTPVYTSTLLSDGLLNSPTPNATALRVYLRGGAFSINNAFYEKDNEISNNGDISSKLKDTVISLLQSINEAIPNTPSPNVPIEIRITAGNDTSHSGSSSRHPKGNALDFTLGSPTSPTWGEKINNSIYNGEDFSGKERQPKSRYTYIDLIDKILSAFIKNNAGTNYINEYYNPSSGANGPHFHFSVKSNFVEI